MKKTFIYISFISLLVSGCTFPIFDDSSSVTSEASSSTSSTSETTTTSSTSESTSASSSSLTSTHAHNLVTRKENEVPTTCIKDGSYIEVTYCSLCKEVISRESKVIPALGHDYIKHNGKEATCTEDGYEDYETCSRCDYSSFKVIPALGHTFGEAYYSWAEDYSSCTATHVCEDCDFVESETVNSEYEVISEATYEEDGLAKYTATFENEDFDTQIEGVILPKLIPHFPTFTIETVDHTPITSKEVYVEGTLDISNANDEKYNASGLTLGIRGRGNYSWSGTEKKSYRIKFDFKYQPLGQGKGACKSWTLLAVHCDKSLLRTDAAFHFASKLSHIPFVSSSSFVDLYLNEEYLGVYELCDQIQVNKFRVNIDDSGTEEDIGYLLELDKNASEDVITLDSGLTFELKSDYVNETQTAFITDYLNRCEEAIESGDKTEIQSLIDIDSAVDSYIVEELFKNLDVGWGSFYYTKPKGDKLSFGPVWDFDLTSGNADSDNADSRFRSYKYTYVGNSYFNYMQQHTWYTSLRECDWFNDLIKERWFEIKDFASETVNYINYMATTYKDCFEHNFDRWDIFNQKINREPNVVMNIKTFQGQVDYFTNWLTNRIDWLDQFYKGEVSDI